LETFLKFFQMNIKLRRLVVHATNLRLQNTIDPSLSILQEQPRVAVLSIALAAAKICDRGNLRIAVRREAGGRKDRRRSFLCYYITRLVTTMEGGHVQLMLSACA
jgi:hypothetical protein